MMKCLIVTVLIISVKSAPYMPMSDQTMQRNQQLDQALMNQIAQQSMEQWLLQNQYNSMQQQLMAMQQLQTIKKYVHSPVPIPYNSPLQPIIILIPNTITKTTNQNENSNNNDKLLKLGIGDADTVVINAENESNIPEMNIIPQRAVVALPNGQRLIIGSIISAIPFLPFEVNVPDTIGWIYNGIAGIIGGIGQRLPFRPKPTTESPVQQNQESMMPAQGSMTPIEGSVMVPQDTGVPMQERLTLIQKLMSLRQNVGKPIVMLPFAPTMPIQVPMQI